MVIADFRSDTMTQPCADMRAAMASAAVGDDVWGEDPTIAALEARARALRLDGASMAEIERATGVPASTLYQWSARGGWRLCDLEGKVLAGNAPEFCDPESFLSSGTSVPSGPRLPRGKLANAAGGRSPLRRPWRRRVKVR